MKCQKIQNIIHREPERCYLCNFENWDDVPGNLKETKQIDKFIDYLQV